MQRWLRFVDEWIDTGVALLIVAAGAVLSVVLAFDGGTFVEVGLVVLVFAAISLRWGMSSYAWRPLRRPPGSRARRVRDADEARRPPADDP